MDNDERAIRPLGFAPFSIFALLGLAAIVFGEADDAPGLVLLGLLFVSGSVLFGVKPGLRTKTNVVKFTLAAVAATVVGALIAGWLENTF